MPPAKKNPTNHFKVRTGTDNPYLEDPPPNSVVVTQSHLIPAWPPHFETFTWVYLYAKTGIPGARADAPDGCLHVLHAGPLLRALRDSGHNQLWTTGVAEPHFLLPDFIVLALQFHMEGRLRAAGVLYNIDVLQEWIIGLFGETCPSWAFTCNRGTGDFVQIKRDNDRVIHGEFHYWPQPPGDQVRGRKWVEMRIEHVAPYNDTMLVFDSLGRDAGLDHQLATWEGADSWTEQEQAMQWGNDRSIYIVKAHIWAPNQPGGEDDTFALTIGGSNAVWNGVML